ncbi:hypothetical protein [Desnuesiella massiliensis]|uniref:hypothetical protein n=1 Tax=Desnuesiella massiliensis TaxID=1650662 RepID=UPI0006E37F2B|nr:hypothetical protein [Desnuesiella massiliensis]
MSGFLKLEDFIEHSDVSYEEAIVQFLQDNGIAIDDFEYVGKCDAERFSVWRRDIRFIEDENIFTFHLDAADETSL